MFISAKHRAAITAIGFVSLVAACSGNNVDIVTPGSFAPVVGTATGNLNAADLTVQTQQTDPNNPLSVRLTIPQGATFTDANGNPIDSSAITVKVTGYDDSAQSLAAFPGGTVVQNANLAAAVNQATGSNLRTDLPVALDVVGFFVFDIFGTASSKKSDAAKAATVGNSFTVDTDIAGMLGVVGCVGAAVGSNAAFDAVGRSVGNTDVVRLSFTLLAGVTTPLTIACLGPDTVNVGVTGSPGQTS